MAIFIFAGHSLTDSGAVTPTTQENIETIKLRNLILKYITPKYKVIIDNDSHSLREVLLQAKTGVGSVVLDIHFNASTNAGASGTETLVADNASKPILRYATEIQSAVSSVLKLKDRGVKPESASARQRLGVMRESGLVCLLEVCFITNIRDMNIYNANKEELAKAIAQVLMANDDKVS